MTWADVMRLACQALWSQRQRSLLTMLGIVVGTASVILLTSIGEGVRVYVLSEFTQFGTTLVAVTPGRINTTGLPGALGVTIHPLTFADATALERVPGIARVVPVIVGAGPIEYGGRTRNTFVYGVTAAVPEVWRMRVRAGRFLPLMDPEQSAPVAVLGPRVKRELFGEANCLGDHIRISGQRFLVIGWMEPKGQFLGFDIDDSVYIPTAAARHLFNRTALQEIDLLIANASLIDSVAERVRQVLIDRHGEEDFTLTTQTGMLTTLDRIIRIVSLAVGGIGAISLLVGAIGILTLMWISVHERTSEIGLIRAVGGTSGQILALFLVEAGLISTVGGICGVAGALSLCELLRWLVPALPVQTPPQYVLSAVAVSLGVGLLSGLLPARKAAMLDPVLALAAE